MNKQSILEKAAFAFAGLVFVGAAWFWTLQVQDVLEILSLAYGD